MRRQGRGHKRDGSTIDRSPAQPRGEQLLPADDVVLTTSDPRHRPFDVMHNLPPDRPGRDRGRLYTPHVHQMPRAPRSTPFGRLCR